MTDIIQTTPPAISSSLPLPEPKIPIAIRPATMDDVPFMDALQKKTTRQVGWMPKKQFEGKIKAGHVLVAEIVGGGSEVVGRADDSRPTPAGYLIGNDQYFKRDDVGIIYQINVVPEYRRSLVAAALLKAQFERSAYGCKLYCCWCAQDIAANKFWEAMGFVPLAFRAGSEKKSRVHIFWQKRIRKDDVTTPWWFPSKTAGGAIREDRIVLPIPPNTHWSDAKPLILPGEAQKELSHESTKNKKKNAFAVSSRSSSLHGEYKSLGGLRFSEPAPAVTVEKPKPEKKPKPKCDPRLIEAARELKDRWLERINDTPIVVVGKYEVSRVIDESRKAPPLLAA